MKKYFCPYYVIGFKYGKNINESKIEQVSTKKNKL